MLSELRVRDLGVIEDLTLSFGPGMTVLTGETGAGKTLVVEALQLVLGGRADVGMVRSGAAEALVEARFVSGTWAPRGLRSGTGTGRGEGERAPRSSWPAPSRPRGARGPGSTGAWPRCAPWPRRPPALVEIHGQHEHRTLVTPAAQRDVLDAFAGTDLSRVRALRSQLRALDEALGALGGNDAERAREADVLRYQVQEIAVAQLEDAGEEQALRLEEERLADAGAYRESGLLATELVGGDGGALDLLGRAGTALGRARGLRVGPGPHSVGLGGAGRRVPLAARRRRGLGGRSEPAGRGPGAPAPAGRAAPQVRRGPGGGDGLRRVGRGPAGRARGRRG